MAFSEEVLQSIKERLNFAEIVGEFVQLKRSGRNFVGLCPFHSEKSPSFFVRVEEASFHCFGCGKKGSVFQFIMEMRGFRFPEAVRYLAKQVGVVLPEETSAQASSSDLTKTLQEIVLLACEVFNEHLFHIPEGRDYLKHRGIDDITTRRFHLGFAPKSWDFLLPKVFERIEKRGVLKDITEEAVRDHLVQVGLLKCKAEEGEGAQKRYYDAFRERLIFPITRSDGRPIAFGGRALGSEPNTPKYINSSESPLYLKRKSLFGIFQALPEARRTRHVFLVEGYMDVISMNQLGITEVVATCGTAATPQHAEVLKRFVDSVTVLFDGDAAGKKAAASCFPSFLNSGLDVEVVFLPEGEDPDSLARTRSANEFRKLVETRISSGECYLRYLMDEETEANGISASASGRIAQKYAAVVAQVKNAVEREFLVRKGAQVLGASIEAIDTLVGEESRKVRVSAPVPQEYVPPPQAAVETKKPPAPKPAKRNASEEKTRAQLNLLYRQLVIAVICEPQIAAAAMKVTEKEALGPVRSELAEKVTPFVEEFLRSGLPGVGQFIAELKASGVKNYIEASQYSSAQALLAAYGLEKEGLLEEAFRQIQIGGSNPNGILEESSGAVSRLSQQFEVRRLREREAEPQDEVALLQLAQEKLHKRRDMEKLRGPSSAAEDK